MAALRFLSALAVVAVAAAATDFSASVSEVEKVGAVLPTLLDQQWADKQAQQAKNLSAAETSLTQGLSAEAESSVTKAFQSIGENVLPTIVANLTAFINKQNNETEQIVKKYDSLLKQRLSSPSSDEAAIHQLRNESQAIVNAWVPLLGQIHVDAQTAFQSAVRTLADAYPHTQAGDADCVAVTEAGIQLLNVFVEEQNADIFVLTTVQMGQFNSYFQQAEKLLIQMLVEAKNAPASGSSSA